VKMYLNLLKLHIEYCRLFFSGHGVVLNFVSSVAVQGKETACWF